MRLAALLGAVALAAGSRRPSDCPNCAPVPVVGSLPWFAATAGGFAVHNGGRYKNRPLYGPHNSGLVLTGDQPISHVADDTTLYGGLLLGLRRGASALWLHDADSVDTSFDGAAVHWEVRDAHLPGLVLTATVLHASGGTGLVVDVNVTDDGTGGASELVWAFGCGTTPSGGQRLGWQYDPLVNPKTLAWTFSPDDCAGNRVVLDAGNRSFTTSFGASSSVAVALATTNVGGSSSLVAADAGGWSNISNFLGGPPRLAAAPPVQGASLWLRASSLAPSHADGAPVAAWLDESGGGATFSQSDTARQPRFAAAGLGAGASGVHFDGVTTLLTSASPHVGTDSTMLAVIRDEGSTGGDGACCSGVIFFNGSFTGVATRPAGGGAVVTTLDWPGSDGYGHTDIRGRAVVAVSLYRAGGPSASYVDGCVEFDAPAVSGTPSAGGAMLGARNDELHRFFLGAIGEIIVFPRALNATELEAMQAYFAGAWPVAPARSCTGTLAVGRSALRAGAGTTRFTIAALANAGSGAAVDPVAQLASARQRAETLTRASAVTPYPLVDAAVRSMQSAVDGLFRADTGCFVHGAMAWDEVYLGWRSEYGATVFGRPELVASEGAYFFSRQIKNSSHTACLSDPALLYTQEAAGSRFHGKGRIDVNGNIYTMQSQFFDQQIHMWRSTGNTTHEALLRPALALSAEWASDCFDADGNGLYSSYANTWPTDSQWYNGGETLEETSYQYRVNLALRDMALRAGDASEAAAYDAVASKIAAAVPSLWVASRGHPAAFREEGGHKRLRPDAWLYSVFLPIEAGLFSPEQAAQALYYTEWALERDAIFCNATNGTTDVCGEVAWTSNWVPSMWSVRQLWSGDNSGLALAYFLTGLADDGWAVLRGNLHRDMLQSAVPGQSGGSNGGTDFNDAVHPLSRALVEGLFGYRPDYTAAGGGSVTITPQPPASWDRASLDTADVHIDVGAAPMAATLAVTLARPVARLVLRLSIRALGLGAIDVTGLPPEAQYNYTVEGGYGESVLVIVATAAAPLIAAASATAAFAGAALPRQPSVFAAAEEGAPLTLAAPAGLALVRFSDPQGVLVPGSGRIAGGALTGVVAAGVAAGAHLIVGYAATLGVDAPLPQIILFKLNVTAAPTPPRASPPPHSALQPGATTWTYATMDAVLNADLGAIFKAGTYLSPRPNTCAQRIGSDGWSAWTFPYWNGPAAPVPTFANVPNMSVGGGVIETPQGARFLLNATSPRNIAFASLWDAYAPTVSVAVPDAPAATAAWVLLAGSTNPMQTLLANAVIRFHYGDGTADELELVPPLNFWSLAGWGSADYDYATDAFCLPDTPPPTVRLGAANRAMLYYHSLPTNRSSLVAVELEALSQEVVVGLLAVSLSAPAAAGAGGGN